MPVEMLERYKEETKIYRLAQEWYELNKRKHEIEGG